MYSELPIIISLSVDVINIIPFADKHKSLGRLANLFGERHALERKDVTYLDILICETAYITFVFCSTKHEYYYIKYISIYSFFIELYL